MSLLVLIISKEQINGCSADQNISGFLWEPEDSL
jgi:hypothetical protein